MHIVKPTGVSGYRCGLYRVWWAWHNSAIMILETDIDVLQEAAENGDAAAQYEWALGLMTGFCKGQSVPLDGVQAYGWFMKAAEQGHGPAMENIGRAYLQGYMGLDVQNRFLRIDRAAAQSWLQRAVVAGAAGACRELGLLLRFTDAHQACGYFYKAAYYFGDVLALRYYGEALLKGEGTAQDTDAAQAVLSSALSMDADMDAEEAARLSEEYGIAVTAPADEATRQAAAQRAQVYYLQALQRRAAAGEPTAQHDLGLRFCLGHGVEQDVTQGQAWIAKSAAAGYAPAAQRLAALEALLRRH